LRAAALPLPHLTDALQQEDDLVSARPPGDTPVESASPMRRRGRPPSPP